MLQLYFVFYENHHEGLIALIYVSRDKLKEMLILFFCLAKRFSY